MAEPSCLEGQIEKTQGGESPHNVKKWWLRKKNEDEAREENQPEKSLP
jgi:hypothetical protein